MIKARMIGLSIYNCEDKIAVGEIFVDVMCIESALQILKCDQKSYSHIYYCQKSSLGFGTIIVKYLKYKTGAVVKQISDVCLVELFKDDVNAYERIQDKARNILHKISNSWIELEFIKEEISASKLNKYKLRAYLEQKGYHYIYRSLELLSIAESDKQFESCTVWLVETPFSSYIKKEHEVNCLFYRNAISKYLPVLKRPAYHYDELNSFIFKSIGRDTRRIILIQWFYYLSRSIARRFCISKSNQSLASSHASIGVEQVSTYVRKSECHDLFWMRAGYVAPELVVNIEDCEQDEESTKTLHDYGVRRARVNPSVTLLFKNLRYKYSKYKKNDISLMAARVNLFYSAVIARIFIKNYCLDNNEHRWIANELRFFCWRFNYWKDIYSQLGIKILWSMRDASEDSLCKAQAIEALNGFYTGSHWSLYPIDMIATQKMYDIYFVWGSYFAKELFKRNRVTVNHYVKSGYPADFYIGDYRNQAQCLRQKYKDKFVIAYIDNNTGNDFQLSPIMQYEMMLVFIDLLDKNSSVQLLYKPKRKHELDVLIREIPELNDYIKQGRVVVYLAKEHGRRVAPVLLGMASNLVVGLGINTAAAECYFSGADVIHANLARFKGGSFTVEGSDIFIFDDVKKVKNKIMSKLSENIVLNNNAAMLIKDIYSKLDPYVDGCSYKRIALVLNELLTLLDSGLSRTEIDTRIANFISRVENKDTLLQISS